MSRVRDYVESVQLIPHTGRHDREMLRAFIASLRASRCEVVPARCATTPRVTA